MVRDKIVRALTRDYILDQNAFLTQLIALLKGAREYEYKGFVPNDYDKLSYLMDKKDFPMIFNEEMVLVSWNIQEVVQDTPYTEQHACLLVRNQVCDNELRIFNFVNFDNDGWKIFPTMIKINESGSTCEILRGYSWYKELIEDEQKHDEAVKNGTAEDEDPDYINDLSFFFLQVKYINSEMPELKRSNQKALEKFKLHERLEQ